MAELSRRDRPLRIDMWSVLSIDRRLVFVDMTLASSSLLLSSLELELELELSELSPNKARRREITIGPLSSELLELESESFPSSLSESSALSPSSFPCLCMRLASRRLLRRAARRAET